MPPPGWIQRSKPIENADLQLFCIPHAGGGGMVFRTWPQYLPDFIEVCAVELPGHGRRISEPPFTRLDPLLAALVEALLPEIDRPYALFGHSFGALVCFEVARELQTRKSMPPILLIVSGARAPQLPASDLPIHKQPDSILIDHVRRMGGTPEAILENEEMLSAILPAIRADYEVKETYEYSNADPVNCPIFAMAGSADLVVNRTSLQAWGALTTGDFNLEFFPGDHFYLFQTQSQVLQITAKALKKALPLKEDA